jgi:hypothetical protein
MLPCGGWACSYECSIALLNQVWHRAALSGRPSTLKTPRLLAQLAALGGVQQQVLHSARLFWFHQCDALYCSQGDTGASRRVSGGREALWQMQ